MSKVQKSRDLLNAAITERNRFQQRILYIVVSYPFKLWSFVLRTVLCKLRITIISACFSRQSARSPRAEQAASSALSRTCPNRSSTTRRSGSNRSTAHGLYASSKDGRWVYCNPSCFLILVQYIPQSAIAHRVEKHTRKVRLKTWKVPTLRSPPSEELLNFVHWIFTEHSVFSVHWTKVMCYTVSC